jgi:hypothetical protein
MPTPGFLGRVLKDVTGTFNGLFFSLDTSDPTARNITASIQVDRTGADAMGEVQAAPTANTLLGRLKGLMDRGDTANTALGSILTSLQAQHAVADTMWTDNSGAYFVRSDVMDSDSGTFVIAWTDLTGAASVAPSTGARPIGRDAALDAMESFYDVGTGGTGYSVGDVLARVVIISNATGVPAVASSAWVNMTTGAVIAAPTAANIIERPKGDATAVNQVTGNTALSGIQADIHAMAVDATPAVTVGLTTVKTSSFTRPADTTAYNVGDQVNDNTAAGSVTPLQFVAASANGGSGMVRKARIRKTSVGAGALTNASFRLHLFTVAPTVSSAGDNSVFTNVSGLAGYAGALDITVDRLLGDGSVGSGGAHSGAEVNYVCAAGDTKLYGLLEAAGAYVPTSGETFNVDLELIPNS